ncbi:MAG TPA: transcription termination/antitermination NusG family protein [Candidatus Saccharimonadales bacterium]|nr:transcription termination/antitermination NusG family protein [Candidatus Saccharimonadales bacterium]
MRRAIIWSVAHTRPRCEKKVVQQCARYGVAATLPCYASRRSYPSKVVVFQKPLFPGYVFLQTQGEVDEKLLRNDYVAQILTIHDQQGFARQLADILAALKAGLEIRLVPEIGTGARVRIKSGALSGIEGWVEERFGGETVLLRLDFIGQAAAVKLSASEIELA